MSTKLVLVLALVVVFLAILVCGGAGALWYFQNRQPANVGPLTGQALAMPADTALIGGIDTKAFFASAGYQQLKSGEIASAPGTADAEKAKQEMREGVEKGLAEAEAKTGIRFDRDLDRLVVAVANVAAPQPEVAVLGFGRFERAKVARALEAAAKAENASLTTKTVAGAEVRLMGEAGKPAAALAFLDESRILVGTQAGVEAVLTNHAARRRPIEANGSLVGLLKGLDPRAEYWLAIDQPLVARVEKESGGAPVPLPRTLTLEGKYDGGLTLAAEMADDSAAKGLAEQIQGGLSMLRGMAEQNPEVQKTPGAMAALDSISVKAAGKRVTLAMGVGAGSGTGLVGVAAALAAPSLGRSRISANEAAAIGDIRTMISAQAAYYSVGGGYGDLRCLAEPTACIEGYAGPVFLDAALASGQDKGGYRRRLHAGAPIGGGRYRSFAYTATPVTPGETGVRAFCGDAMGLICVDPAGGEIRPLGGSCPRPCQPLDGGYPAPPPPPPVVTRPAPAPATTQAVRVGGGIREPRKITHVNPLYPEVAKSARVQGVVILECTIDPQGRVSDVRVLRGIPLLDEAALEAVRQWVYTPTLLDGVPVPVIMTVTINFRLN